MPIVAKHEKYLGLATVAGRSKKELFTGIVDRIRKKLKGWKERVLSVAAREVLIKSVAQAQLSYAMTVFKVPEGVLDEVHSMIMAFWWGQKGTERRVSWLRREEMVCSKMEGGMGFRDLKGFNMALLAKQLWNLYQRPNSLIATILRAKYHKHVSILDARAGYNPSYMWRSLMSALDFLNSGLRWRIGNGDSVCIWGDKWVPSSPELFVPSAPRGLPVDSRVSALIDPITEQWDLSLLENCFPNELVRNILKIPLRGIQEPDRLIWSTSKNGSYSVLEGYRFWLKKFKEENGVNGFGEEVVWKKMWNMNIAPKIKQFIWRFAREVLPTGDHISEKSQRHGDKCPFCDLRETQIHLFGDCQWTSRIWRTSEVADCFNYQPVQDCYGWFKQVMEKVDEETLESWSVMLWYLWKERNAQLFNGQKLAEEEIVIRAKYYLQDYKANQAKRREEPEVRVEKAWQPPLLGEYKINTDAGFGQAGGVTLGVVIRGEQGKFTLAAAKRLEGD
ncbi:unnamed protein product [Linum trigynum]|uniref:Reverse transcriptase zinc-binding domain-containing protein n=1 Tax=Linum trigynum TaxID=586398 RepID=A0AAV2FES8_9ROSI